MPDLWTASSDGPVEQWKRPLNISLLLSINVSHRKMKIAKATPEEVDALLNLMRVLNTAEDGIPCKPDGTWEEGEDMAYFDTGDEEHLRKFYDRVMGCFENHPGGLIRTIGGYHLAMTNDVFDPDADTYEWHPTLAAAVEARGKENPQNDRA